MRLAHQETYLSAITVHYYDCIKKKLPLAVIRN